MFHHILHTSVGGRSLHVHQHIQPWETVCKLDLQGHNANTPKSCCLTNYRLAA